MKKVRLLPALVASGLMLAQSFVVSAGEKKSAAGAHVEDPLAPLVTEDPLAPLVTEDPLAPLTPTVIQASVMVAGQGSMHLDYSYGTGSIEFPRWPGWETFDRAFTVWKKFHPGGYLGAWSSADAQLIVSFLPWSGFRGPAKANWDRLSAAMQTLKKMTSELWLAYPSDGDRDRPYINALEQARSAYRKEWLDLGERQSQESSDLGRRASDEMDRCTKQNGRDAPACLELGKRHLREGEQLRARHLQEGKDLQIKHFKQHLEKVRAIYREQYDRWEKLREAIYEECRDYYDVSTAIIRNTSTPFDENRAKNLLRAGGVHSEMMRLGTHHPANSIFCRSLLTFNENPPHLTDAELERMFVDTSLPPKCHWRLVVPSTACGDAKPGAVKPKKKSGTAKTPTKKKWTLW